MIFRGRRRLHLDMNEEAPMAAKATRNVFINLAVRDLEKSKSFFSTLGFEFNAQFTDAKAACMVISDAACVMLLSEPFFKGFTKRQPCDTRTQTEAMIALSCSSREEVDSMTEAAVRAGGTQAMPPQDHGFMYGRSFYDPDGHHWEVMWMDPKHVQ
jgi:predicted lactoylglutathione lyase